MSEININYKGSKIAGMDASGTKTLLTQGKYCEGNIAVEYNKPAAPTPSLQSKTKSYTPTESAQTESVSADSGYDGLDTVSISVGAIDSNYVGSGITQRSSSDLTASGATVTVPSGFYENNASKAIAAGSLGNETVELSKEGADFCIDISYPDFTAGYYSNAPEIGITLDIENKSVTPSTSQQVITPTATSNYLNSVTVAAMPSGTEGTPTATKGAVSSHSITVTPSVTNTAGYISGGTKNGTAVTVSASELVSGDLSITQNGNNIDCANYSTVSVNVSGGGGSSMQRAVIGEQSSMTSSSLTFTGLQGEPKSFIAAIDEGASTSSPATIAAVVFDGTSLHGQTLSTTANANASYDTGFTKSYSNGTLTITATTAQFKSAPYALFYTYGDGSVDTKDVQVGSGATSITFTGLEDEPIWWSCIFKSNFSTSSGYQRVIYTAINMSDTVFGMALDSSAHMDAYWTATYNNGSLTITSRGTNQGGYFHQPGYYQLTYAYDDGSGGNYQSKTVTPTISQQVVEADTGYDALKKVTVNAIPSEYIVPSGNISITSNTATGQTLNVAQYATATVAVPTGGSTNIGTKTATGSSSYTSSLSFTSLSGTPKAFFVRLTTQISRSSSNRYYYVENMRWDGSSSGGVAGRCFYQYSGQLTNITSGYSYSYSSGTLTITSSAGSRSASPGAFYNGTYELVYIY